MLIRIFLILALAFPLSSCSNFAFSVDKKIFEYFGGTIWSSPAKISLREVHLDNGTLLGQLLLLQGDLVEVGKYFTYLVIADDNTRLLVSLSEIIDAERKIHINSSQQVRILGVLERGKRGLPIVAAKAMKIVNTKDTK